MKFFLILTVILITDSAGQIEFPSQTSHVSVEAKIKKLKTLTQKKTATSTQWIRLGNAQMQKARNTQSHDFTNAAISFEKALTLNPDSPDAMLGMAWVKNSEHQFEEGQKWAEKTLEIEPGNQDAHALIGDYAVERGDYDEAYDHYQAALDSKPNLSSYARASHLLWLTGDTTQAQTLMQKAIASGGPYPENEAWCRTELAMMQLQLGATLGAEQQIKKAYALAPQNPRVLAGMARIKSSQGEIDEAIELYTRSEKVMPTHEVLAALADLYRAKGDQAALKKQIKRVISFHGHHTHGHGHYHHHDESQPSLDLAMFMTEFTHHHKDALAEAKKAYRTYKSIKSEHTLAWCYFQTAQYVKARRHIERALKWNTKDSLLMYHAGMIYQKLEKPARASKLISQALDSVFRSGISQL